MQQKPEHPDIITPSTTNSNGNVKRRLTDTSLDGLVPWLKENDAIINNIVVKNVPGSGRGLFTNAQANEGELLIRIPSKCLVNVGSLASLHSQYPATKELSAHQQLTIFIVLESRNRHKSWWKEYINSLPPLSEFKGMPILWTRPWQSQLPPASKRYFIQESYEPLTQDIQVVTEFFEQHSLGIPPMQILIHAWLCVNTRCVYYFLDSLPAHHKDNMTLVPFIDMTNHSSAENVSIVRADDALEIRSKRKIEENEEIVFSYHSTSSRFWICEYGFLMQVNEYDDLDISGEIERIVERRKDWLENEGADGWEYTISGDGEVSFRIQVALRSILVSEENELREFMGGRRDGSEYQGQVNRILREILAAKIEVCKVALDVKNEECIESNFIRRLWEGELYIARVAYDQSQQES